jgi:hypothetical protein
MSIVYVHSRHARRTHTGRRRNVADLTKRSERAFFATAFTLLAACGSFGVITVAHYAGMVNFSL